MDHAKDINSQQLSDYADSIVKMSSDLIIAYTSQKMIIQAITEECLSYIDQFRDSAAESRQVL